MTDWLSRLQEVFGARTPGPWRPHKHDSASIMCAHNDDIAVAEAGGNENRDFIALAGTIADDLLAVVRTADILVGPVNIGKTVNTNIYWSGAISAIMEGKALSDLVVALAELKAKAEPLGVCVRCKNPIPCTCEGAR